MICRDCGDAREMMAAYWRRELADADASALRQHLETCAECSAEMTALSGLWERLGDLPAPEPGPSLDARWELTMDTLTRPARRTWSLAQFWPRTPAWQAAVAFGCLVIGLMAGMNLPRQNQEIAKLREEVASTREMVVLSLMQQQSATERLRGVDYTGRLPNMAPDVVSALTQAVAHDPSVNVRLAAIDALSKAPGKPEVLESLTHLLPQQDSPMVQAAMIDYLVDARDRRAVGALRQLAAQADINPTVQERARYALQQLSH